MESLLGEGGLLPAVCGARRLYVRRSLPLPGKEKQAEREDRGGLGPTGHDATVSERQRAPQRGRVGRCRSSTASSARSRRTSTGGRLGSAAPSRDRRSRSCSASPARSCPRRGSRTASGARIRLPRRRTSSRGTSRGSARRSAGTRSRPGAVATSSASHPDALDLQQFERLAHDGSSALERGDAARAAGSLSEALGLWRGPALADLADEPALGCRDRPSRGAARPGARAVGSRRNSCSGGTSTSSRRSRSSWRRIRSASARGGC